MFGLVFIYNIINIINMDDKTYKVFEVKGSLKVTLPKVLAQAVGIGAGDKVMWVVDRGELVLRKVD